MKAKLIPAADLKIGDYVEVYGETDKWRGCGEVILVETSSIWIEDAATKENAQYNFNNKFRLVS